MKPYFISYSIAFVLLLSCSKKEETKPVFTFENTSWVAIEKNGMPVNTNSGKEYLFFSVNTLENYYDFLPIGCFKTENSKYELNGSKLKLTFDDTSTEEEDWVLNSDGTLRITFNYSVTDKDIKIYQKTENQRSALKKCE